MIMRSNKKISLISAAAILLFPTVLSATGTNAPVKEEGYNMALISLVSLMLVLLFVIGMLANTVSQLSNVLRDRFRKERNEKGIVKTILLLAALSLSTMQVFAGDAAKTAKPVAKAASNFISGIPVNDFYAIMSVIAIELLVIFMLVIYIKMLLRAISNKLEAEPKALPKVERSWFWDKFNAAVPIEKEKDLLLDHDYDGIQELDNSLPPWWKYGFYLTIIVACIYFYRYHVSHDGPSPREEYAEEMRQGEEDKAAYLLLSGNNIDENTVTMLTDAGELAAGKETFIKNCAPCHLADGGGLVGPNLTDEYWLHGGSIKDIFKTIKYGWQDKGMKSWKDDFSAKQIQQLASFINQCPIPFIPASVYLSPDPGSGLNVVA